MGATLEKLGLSAFLYSKRDQNNTDSGGDTNQTLNFITQSFLYGSPTRGLIDFHLKI